LTACVINAKDYMTDCVGLSLSEVIILGKGDRESTCKYTKAYSWDAASYSWCV